MKQFQVICFLVLSLITSVCLPVQGFATEVSTFTDEQNTHIRSLAASCAACHGTFGNSVVNNQNIASKSTESKGANAVLAGIAATELTEKLLGFRDGSRKATVMHRHAKGLTIDEINQLAAHFSKQQRIDKSPIKSEILKADHE